ncbi:MAG: hypothetical protein JAY99_01710 [Candidatus Thiodiazotropha lotti]|nr:hypothetical protein [Candidatus Thiodiazotropha lotti]MCG7991192.1 hypothetical protein [Candidatus Thiodiazotropha lotti]MCG7998218.1 hypothetical protein [Candidatus Thiodiazotropha lotti]MCW4182847.1 hypothetical protein [Candidatus Thiodiazotropha weberae]MCW4189984.1 hypothetical protein [Candidatus Thiodiazotropha weberae]
MNELITLICFIAVVGIIYYMYYKNKHSPIWKSLSNNFPHSSIENLGRRSLEMVFFWEDSDPENIDYFNSMYVSASNEGVSIQPTINNIGAGSIFIPWHEVTHTGSKWLFLRKRALFHLEGQGITIAIMNKWLKTHKNE